MLLIIRKSNNESGFTLIESLLVLSIVTIMTAIIIPVGERWIQTTAEEDAITSIVATIYGLQSYSMANMVYTKLSFRKAGSRTMYVAEATDGKDFSRKLLPEGMSVSSSSKLKAIEFHGNGDVFNFGTLTIVGKSGRTKITFQFQRGRMIISESKRIFLAGSNPYPHSPHGHLWNAIAIRNENDLQA